MTDTPRTDDDETPREILASRLIDAWCADKGRKIPWAKAIQIVAIVTKQPDEERDRLLRMGDEDGACEMCGRKDAALVDDAYRATETEWNAKRYEVLRVGINLPRYGNGMGNRLAAEALDAAIDAALSVEKGEKG